MTVSFSGRAWAQYLHWQKTDKTVVVKINVLIRECTRHPFEGTGKPEPLKGALSGWWSRRINREHRLVYRVLDGDLQVAQCRYHY